MLQVLDGQFYPAKAGGQLNPVTWLEIARYAWVVEGARPYVHLDDGVLQSWLLRNLAGYWTSWVTRSRAFWASRDPAELIEPASSVPWGVLGPGRLRYTLETGEVVSKTKSGWYTAQRYPQWAELCERAVYARAGESITFTVADGLMATDLMAAVITG